MCKANRDDGAGWTARTTVMKCCKANRDIGQGGAALPTTGQAQSREPHLLEPTQRRLYKGIMCNARPIETVRASRKAVSPAGRVELPDQPPGGAIHRRPVHSGHELGDGISRSLAGRVELPYQPPGGAIRRARFTPGTRGERAST